ncbi:ECF-type sigma factor [Thalassotalea sediminis]|uniref:ECF-type sigma factor n=1 Tax=Thalassotalea sediminis TaxID=1759089 RepID=UPI0025740951|nr:ECF-type sigma factor [Thalassotalea sediminis]
MEEQEVLKLIKGWQLGEPKATKLLMNFAYLKIKEYAKINHENLPEDANTAIINMSATDIAHDAYLKLTQAESQISIETQRQFYSYVNSAVRNVFIDHYRKQVKAKSRNPDKTQFESTHVINKADEKATQHTAIITMNDEIELLTAEFPRQAEVLELRYFAQRSNKEIARLLNVSVRTIENDLRFARAWLKKRLS